MHHVVEWYKKRRASKEATPRECWYGKTSGAEGNCAEEITLRDSSSAGHRGFCSHEHSVMDQEEQAL